MLRKSLPLEEVRNQKLLVRLDLSARNITGRKASYKGVKVALHISTPNGEGYPQLNIPEGDIPWQKGGFTAYVPPEATSCILMLGLEEVGGEAYFDNVEIYRQSPQPGVSAHLDTMQPPPGRRVLRGLNVSANVTAGDLHTIASWGANHIRWQLWNGFTDVPSNRGGLDNYRSWLHESITYMRLLLPLCDSLGLKVVVDLHSLPGGRLLERVGQEHRIFNDSLTQNAFRGLWKEIATDLKGKPAIWGYDLANEPIEGFLPGHLSDWQQLAQQTAKDIIAIDPTRHIIIEGAPGGSPDALRGFATLHDVPNTVYSFHMYEPAVFTHQGIFGLSGGVRYPGSIMGRYWDKNALRQYLAPIRTWQLQHNATIYVGEFSSVRWAPDSSSYNYLRDCISIFEDWGWHWAYHGYGYSDEWDGWSLEHDSDPDNHNKPTTPTDRLQLMMDSFRREEDN